MLEELRRTVCEGDLMLPRVGLVAVAQQESSTQGKVRIRARGQSYLVEVGDMERAGERLYAEAVRRGIDPAVQTVACLAMGHQRIGPSSACTSPSELKYWIGIMSVSIFGQKATPLAVERLRVPANGSSSEEHASQGCAGVNKAHKVSCRCAQSC